MDKDTYQELLRLKKSASTAAGVAIGAFAFTAIIGIIGIEPLVPVGFVLLIVSAIFASKKNKAYSNFYKENIVKNITLDECDFLENVSFNPDAGISRDEIWNLGVLHGDRFSSNDLITATYKGVNFRQSDVYVGEVTRDSDGHTHEYTIFQGRWLVFDFNKNFDWDLQVVSKSFGSAGKIGGGLFSKAPRAKKVELESASFNKMFKVFAQDEHEAFYILTPNMMQKLEGLKEDLKAPIMLIFAGGKLHIAVYNGKDAFEGKLFGALDIEEEKKRMLSDLKLITDFVDVLALERDIYK